MLTMSALCGAGTASWPTARGRCLFVASHRRIASAPHFSARRTAAVPPPPRAVRGDDDRKKAATDDDDQPPMTPQQVAASESLGVYGAALALAVAATALTVLYGDQLGDALFDLEYGDADGAGGVLSLMSGGGAVGLGDVFAAALWSVTLWFVSPLQLLLLFLGKIETERPSDFLISRIGRAAGLSVDAVDYTAPSWVRAAAAAACAAGGAGIAWASSAGLGDSTWAIAGGVGTAMAAGLFEVGRPPRLSADEAIALEAAWQEFARFADVHLQRGGRCHESEVFASFRRASPRYRAPDALGDSALRDMVRNWAGAPGAVERTRSGYLKGVSLRPSVDAFTGERRGIDLAAQRLGGGGGGAVGGDGGGGDVQQQQQKQQVVSSGGVEGGGGGVE